MRLPKTRKGISPIIATVLLILIAIATGIVIYAFMAGWIGTRFSTSSGPQAVLVIESGYYNKSGYFVLYVRNDGSANVNISRAYITAPDGSTVLVKAPTTSEVVTSANFSTVAFVGAINKSIYNPPVKIFPAEVPANGTAVEIIVAVGNTVNITPGYVYTIKVVGSDGSETFIRIRA